MKKLTKLLALLLAGLLMTASLFACGGDDTSDDGEKEEQDENEDSFEEYKKLSPEEVFEALEDAEQFLIELERDFDGDTAEMAFERDGDAVKYTMKEDGSDTQSMYFDVKKGIQYRETEDGSYVADEDDDFQWDSLLDALLDEVFYDDDLDFLLSDDSYDKDGSVYTVTEDAWLTLFDEDEFADVDATATMTRKGTKYTFEMEVDTSDDDLSWECVIEFKETNVKLPKVENENPAQTDASQKDEQQVTTVAPEATQAPEEPITSPDESATAPIPDEMMSPEEIYAQLVATTDGTISLQYEENQVRWYYTFEKAGDLLKCSYYTSENYTDVTVYFDNANGYRYYKDGDTWYYEVGTMSWQSIIDEVNDRAQNLLTLSDDNFEYNNVRGRILLTETAANKMNVADAALLDNTASGGSYVYTITDSNWDTISVSLKMSVFGTINLPSAEPAPSVTPPVGADLLAPSQLYDALISADEVGFAVQMATTSVICEKSGKIIRYTQTVNNVTEIRYIDTANQMGYFEEGGTWYYTPLTESTDWASLLGSLSINSSTYLFQDRYYNAFSETDDTLSISDSALTGSNMNRVTMTRTNELYTVYEYYTDGSMAAIAICFEDMGVTLPTNAVPAA